ncbi:hypothetical protein LINPERPRIM_LOCUS1357 [Linum perenne]
MHMLRPSTLLETSFDVIGRCRLFMCTESVTMQQTSSLVEDTNLYLLVSIVLSLAIICCIIGFSMTNSVFLKNV